MGMPESVEEVEKRLGRKLSDVQRIAIEGGATMDWEGMKAREGTTTIHFHGHPDNFFGADAAPAQPAA